MSDVIEIGSEALRVRILCQGATLVGVRFGDQPRNLVLGFEDPADHARIPGFAGHLAGPVANRIRAGRVVVAGQIHQMPLNENGQNTLHSGPDGLHAQLWDITEHSARHVELTCTLADGANGLPGMRRITAHYEVRDTTLRLTLCARTDKATPINIAAHPYWNLDGAAQVNSHHLQVAATTYLPTDAQNLPTGQVAPVTGTAFDFVDPSPVPLDPALDVNFCLSDGMRADPVHAATLRGRDGTTLDISTTCPGLQIYNGAHLPDLPAKMSDCPSIGSYSGIALEPQHWPDAMSHDHFPQIILHPDSTYTQVTQFQLTRPLRADPSFPQHRPEMTPIAPCPRQVPAQSCSHGQPCFGFARS